MAPKAVRDVHPDTFIKAYAAHLKANDKVGKLAIDRNKKHRASSQKKQHNHQQESNSEVEAPPSDAEGFCTVVISSDCVVHISTVQQS